MKVPAFVGWFADYSTSRRAPFLIGLSMLGVGTIMLWVATNIYYVLASRILQGLSASIVYTVGLALLVDTVDRNDIGQFIGYFTSSTNVALLVSPLLGGVIYSEAGYYAVVIVIFALITVDVLLRLALIERKTMLKYARPIENDTYGTCTNDQTQGRNSSFCNDQYACNDTTTTLPAIPAIEEQFPVVVSEEQQVSVASDYCQPDDTPQILPLVVLLKSPRLLTAIYGIFVNFTLLASFDGVLPWFVGTTFEWTSLGAGLIFLCIALPSLLAPLVGILSDKYGPRWLVVSGFILTTPSLVLLRKVEYNSLNHVLLLCALLTLIGTFAYPFTIIDISTIKIEESYSF